MTVSFLFRKPKFPILCDIDGYVIAAKSISGFEKQLSAYNICKGSRYPIIDITGEGWSFYTEHMAISPLTTKKKWFKTEVIAIFNSPSTIEAEAARVGLRNTWFGVHAVHESETVGMGRVIGGGTLRSFYETYRLQGIDV